MNKKIIRVTTIPASLRGLLKGQLRFMSNHFEVIGISSDQNGLLEEFGLSEGITTKTVEMTRNITPIQDIKGVYKLYKIFKKEKPDIVHTHTPKAGTLGMFAAKLAGVPNRLHTIAGLPLVEETGLKRKLLNAVEKFTYYCATKIYPNSYGLQDIVLNHKFTRTHKLHVIGNGSSNGINTNYFNPEHFDELSKKVLRKELGIKPDDFVYIFVGRLVVDKGITELVSAFSKINQKYNRSKLLLVGVFEPHLDPLAPSTTEEIKNNKNIIHTGWQNDVRPYFYISNALTFPSYREGFPNVVMQAGAMELASIVTDINGCNEIVRHNENGVIVPVKNTERLFEAMQDYILKTEQDLNAMGKKSREHIVKRYDQQFVWDALLEEYNKIIN
ncbi:glycosyltransferase family 4 protein [Seonamhaeicola sp. MEBiC1930]|uniref:glycosyltransferase family 4 protein n=1 Tax=Seonamhaeicola sp. MEBiC01930 TaxID=2976768 RepID=UPI0032517FA9